MIEEKPNSYRKSKKSKNSQISKEKASLLTFQKEFSQLFQAINDCSNKK